MQVGSDFGVVSPDAEVGTGFAVQGQQDIGAGLQGGAVQGGKRGLGGDAQAGGEGFAVSEGDAGVVGVGGSEGIEVNAGPEQLRLGGERDAVEGGGQFVAEFQRCAPRSCVMVGLNAFALGFQVAGKSGVLQLGIGVERTIFTGGAAPLGGVAATPRPPNVQRVFQGCAGGEAEGIGLDVAFAVSGSDVAVGLGKPEVASESEVFQGQVGEGEGGVKPEADASEGCIAAAACG